CAGLGDRPGDDVTQVATVVAIDANLAHALLAVDVPGPHRGRDAGRRAGHPGVDRVVRGTGLAEVGRAVTRVRPARGSTVHDGLHRVCGGVGDGGRHERGAALGILAGDLAAVIRDELVDDDGLAVGALVGDRRVGVRLAQRSDVVLAAAQRA